MLKLVHNKTIILGLLISFILCIFIYRDSFSSYFFQDDWFSLKISRINNPSEILSFFIPRTDVIYFRPLGMQMPFYLLYSFFGLNHLPFSLLNLFIHGINISLVYILIKQILNNSKHALLVSFLYATSSVFYIPFYWSATFAFMLGPTFFFTVFILSLKFIKTNDPKLLLLSAIVFILGLLTNEIIIVFPIILLIYILFKNKKINIKFFATYFIFCTVYLILRFILFPSPVKGLYRMEFGWHILSNIKTYLLWTFNWSEIITEQMVKPFVFNSLIMKNDSFTAYLSVIFFLFMFLAILSGFIISIKIPKYKERTTYTYFILGVFWFILGLSPVLLFSNHKFPYYLPISLVGSLIPVVLVIDKLIEWISDKKILLSKICISTLLILWTSQSFITVSFNNKYHWAPRRAYISKKIIKTYKNQDGIPSIIRIPDSSENFLALNNQDAFNIVFNDNVVTIYEK